jgi:hypothetical protein
MENHFIEFGNKHYNSGDAFAAAAYFSALIWVLTVSFVKGRNAEEAALFFGAADRRQAPTTRSNAASKATAH